MHLVRSWQEGIPDVSQGEVSKWLVSAQHVHSKGEACGMERLGGIEPRVGVSSPEEDNNVFTKMLTSLVGEISVLESNNYLHFPWS